MIFHHFYSPKFVSKLMNLLEIGSPECITLPFPSCLSSFFFFALTLSICFWKGCMSPREFCDPIAWRRVTRTHRTIQSETCLQDFEDQQGQRLLRFLFFFFLSGCFQLVKVLQAFIRAAERIKIEWVSPRERYSISGLVLGLLKYVWLVGSVSTVFLRYFIV